MQWDEVKTPARAKWHSDMFVQLQGGEDGGDSLEFSESFPKEYWVRGEETGRGGR